MTITDTNPNQLYFGDNLDILRQHVADETVSEHLLWPAKSLKIFDLAADGEEGWAPLQPSVAYLFFIGRVEAVGIGSTGGDHDSCPDV